MKKQNWPRIVSIVLVIGVVVWLLAGGRVRCRESMWDKDKKVIEIKHPGDED